MKKLWISLISGLLGLLLMVCILPKAITFNFHSIVESGHFNIYLDNVENRVVYVAAKMNAVLKEKGYSNTELADSISNYTEVFCKEVLGLSTTEAREGALEEMLTTMDELFVDHPELYTEITEITADVLNNMVSPEEKVSNAMTAVYIDYLESFGVAGLFTDEFWEFEAHLVDIGVVNDKWDHGHFGAGSTERVQVYDHQSAYDYLYDKITQYFSRDYSKWIDNFEGLDIDNLIENLDNLSYTEVIEVKEESDTESGYVSADEIGDMMINIYVRYLSSYGVEGMFNDQFDEFEAELVELGILETKLQFDSNVVVYDKEASYNYVYNKIVQYFSQDYTKWIDNFEEYGWKIAD